MMFSVSRDHDIFNAHSFWLNNHSSRIYPVVWILALPHLTSLLCCMAMSEWCLLITWYSLIYYSVSLATASNNQPGSKMGEIWSPSLFLFYNADLKSGCRPWFFTVGISPPQLFPECSFWVTEELVSVTSLPTRPTFFNTKISFCSF